MSVGTRSTACFSLTCMHCWNKLPYKFRVSREGLEDVSLGSTSFPTHRQSHSAFFPTFYFSSESLFRALALGEKKYGFVEHSCSAAVFEELVVSEVTPEMLKNTALRKCIFGT